MSPRSLLLFGHAALALINTPIKRRLEQRRGKDPLRVCNMSTISLSTKKNKQRTYSDIVNKDVWGHEYALTKVVVELCTFVIIALCEVVGVAFSCIDTIVAIQSD